MSKRISSFIFIQSSKHFKLNKPCLIDQFIMISTGERPRHESIKCARSYMYCMHTCGSTGYRERLSTIILLFGSCIERCFSLFYLFISITLSLSFSHTHTHTLAHSYYISLSLSFFHFFTNTISLSLS